MVRNRLSLHRIPQSYFAYCHRSRTHLSLGKAWPSRGGLSRLKWDRGLATGRRVRPPLRTTGRMRATLLEQVLMRNSTTILPAREADTLPVFVASEAIMELPSRVIRLLRLRTRFFLGPDRVFGRAGCSGRYERQVNHALRLATAINVDETREIRSRFACDLRCALQYAPTKAPTIFLCWQL